MANQVIRKDLWQRLNNVTPKDWQKAGDRLIQIVVNPASGKGSHCIFRDANNPDKTNPNSLVATIPCETFKQSNQSIFKHLLDFGINEDDIWKALKFLKR